ncbi:MAG: hypothetical protein MJ187_02630 [Alphaproteobacteria bacterium]|nr:hypothetical protein [Alphaproteobacteria bacterium]
MVENFICLTQQKKSILRFDDSKAADYRYGACGGGHRRDGRSNTHNLDTGVFPVVTPVAERGHCHYRCVCDAMFSGQASPTKFINFAGPDCWDDGCGR